MQIKLYKTTDKPNTINKVLADVKTITGNALEPFSLISPTVKIKIDDDVLNANYAYIEKFKRYYFIKEITAEAGFFNITLTVDALESHKADILDYNGILERQEYDYNLYLVDNEIAAYSKTKISYKKFPNKPFSPTVAEDGLNFVLITTSD